MPRFDGMGPKGEGPKTGRGLGKCDETKTNEVVDTSKVETSRMGRKTNCNKRRDRRGTR